MLSQPTELVPTQRGLPAIIDGSGRKARDRIEHFLRAAIDNNNTRKAYGRALGSFFAFLEDGGRERVQDVGPLDVRDYLEAAKANGLSTAILKQHMAAIRMLFDHLVTGGVLEHNPALSVKAPRQKLGKGKAATRSRGQVKGFDRDVQWPSHPAGPSRRRVEAPASPRSGSVAFRSLPNSVARAKH